MRYHIESNVLLIRIQGKTLRFTNTDEGYRQMIQVFYQSKAVLT
ncbi:hypothetical protein [Candidatus Regiella insecticola]|uniref:Transposase n=1 Tax=Candidatus Regiella insecticola TaxID=138073 RepID=A0A6L2ZSI0_9ENTR|nr:hypothetical protein [Candidatus Regiella insecticola]GFN47467.1 hypothetical protein RINTU1_35690 [Candidatus Regiella insecticola]GFN47475.1 hypothetical protein RINTU1_35750 [Candidatus Regiella insecticola]